MRGFGLSAPGLAIQSKVKTGNTDRPSTTVDTSDPHLTSFDYADGAYYWMEVFLIPFSASATPNFKWSWVKSAGAFTSLLLATQAPENGGFAANTQRADTMGRLPILALTAGIERALHMTGIFNPTGAGTLGLAWSQQVSNATPTTLRAGSFMRMERIG